MKNWFSISLMMFIFSLIGYCLNNKHIMVMLLMTEFMMLSMILGMSSMLGMFFYSWVIMIIIFVLVCESVMGISSMILISRTQKGDMIENMNIIKC